MASIKYNLVRRSTTTGSLGVAYIRDEVKIRYIVENADAGNVVRIEGQLVGQASWDLLLDISGTDNQVVDVSTYELVRVSVVTYDSLSNYIDVIGSSFDKVASSGGTVDSVNGQTGAVLLALDDLSDVNAPAPALDDILVFDGAEWVSSPNTAQQDIDDHIANPTAAHAASAISYDDSVTGYGLFDVQSTVDQLFLDEESTNTALAAHLTDMVDAHDASAISVSPTGNLTTDVQSSLEALDVDIQDHITETVGAHAASAISNIPSGNLSAIEVQAALNELQTDIDSREPTITVLPIAKGGTNNSSAYTAGSVIFSDGTSLTQDNANLFFNDASNYLKVQGKIELGSADPFARLQIWNYLTNSVLRLGSWQADGDATSASSEGEVVYGNSLTGLAISPSNGGYARIKHNRFGLFSIDSSLPAYTAGDYFFRVDDSTLYLRNNSGTKTFEVTRSSGQIDTSLGAGVVQSDASGILSSSALAASSIVNTPAGTISSTTVQAAINELDGDIQAHITDAVDAHDASAISNIPSGNLSATEVQAALNELQTDVDTRTAGPASSVDGEVALFDGVTGKLLKSATGTGFAKLTAGVLSTSATVNAATELSGVTPVANGGTGDSTLTANNLLVGAGTSPVTFIAPGTAGNVLKSNGTVFTSVALAASEVTNTPSGNLSATNVQSALNELQSDIDTRALDSAVIKKDGSVAFTGDQSMGGFNLTNLADPLAAQDAATKAYVDAFSEGLKPKEAVRAGTLVNGTLATAFENGDVIDGVTLATGDRILIKDQTAAEENGIYIVQASGAPTRAPDFDSLTPVDEINGSYTFIQEGSQAGQGWVQTGVVATIGVDPINFVFFNSVSGIIGGDGITVTGSTVSVDHDGEGLTFVATQLALELDGATLSKSASGLKLGDTAVTPGTYGSANETVTFTVDQQGRLTAASEQSISITASQVSDFTTAASAAAPVQSVNTQTGAVVLTTTNIAEGTNLYFTDERVDDRVATLIVAGTGITSVYSDPGNTLTISTTITQYTDEMSQDAVGTILTDSNTIDFTYTDATPSITADVRTQMSLTSDASGIKLVNDATSPGNSKYYGTDSGGTKGFFTVSTGSAGDIGETSFSAANNQATPADVTGLAFAAGVVRGFDALLTVSIDATSDLYEIFQLVGINKNGSFDMAVSSVGDNSGIVFSITSAGQVQYTSTNLAGFVSDTMKFRAETLTV